jgi:disulfide bond formation protein DsbB
MRGTQSAARAAAVVFAVATVTILGAWFFQLVLGLAPCPLCLEQRIAYYVSIPLAAAVWFTAGRLGAPSARVAAAGLGIIALAMLLNAGLGFYHAGIEWKWWLGPQECSGTLDPLAPGGDLFDNLRKGDFSVVRCDEAAWRDPFGLLSLAGYNVLISLGLAITAARGALAAWHGKA